MEETNKIIKEFEVKSTSDSETIGRMAAEIYKLRTLRLQELKENILEKIDRNYSIEYIMDSDGESIPEYYFDIDTCTEEIEKLFNEVE